MKCTACGGKDFEEYFRDRENGYIVYRCIECNHLEYYADTESKPYIISKKQEEIDGFVALFKAKVVELVAIQEKTIAENKARVESLSNQKNKLSMLLDDDETSIRQHNEFMDEDNELNQNLYEAKTKIEDAEKEFEELNKLYNIINEGKFISNSYIYYLHAKDDPRSIYDYLPSGDIYLTILENPSEINIEKVKEIVALLNININDIFDYSK